ncbi:MAG: recombinase family protein [Oscillospiraceae bacterium]
MTKSKQNESATVTNCMWLGTRDPELDKYKAIAQSMEFPKGFVRFGIIYARFSSHNQKEESIDQQVKEGLAYAQENGIKLIGIYADRHVTGRTDKRREFQKMIRDSEHGYFNTVITYKTNRMARNMMNALFYEDRLVQRGINVVYLHQMFDNTPAGRFALRSMMNIDQFYSENMAEDIKRGLYENAEQCIANRGRLGLGYRRGADGKYEIVPDTAAIVKEIFERLCDDEQQSDIIRDFNARGLKTATGKEWSKNSLRAIIRNVAYKGVYKYAEVIKPGGVPKIVEEVLFDTVNKKFDSENRPGGRHSAKGDYILTGKLFCGKCGSPMVGVSGTSETKALHYYYVCQKKRADHSCDKKNVQRDMVEHRVAEAVRMYVLQDEVMEWIADQSIKWQSQAVSKAKSNELKKQHAAVEKAIKNIMEAIEHGIYTSGTQARLLELEQQEKDLAMDVALQEAKLPKASKDDILFWLDSFRVGDVKNKDYQRKLIKTFVRAVYLFDDESGGKVKVAFSYANANDTVTLSLMKNIENEYESSYSGRLSPPNISICVLAFPALRSYMEQLKCGCCR